MAENQTKTDEAQASKTETKPAESKTPERKYTVTVPQEGKPPRRKRFSSLKEAEEFQASLSANKKGS